MKANTSTKAMFAIAAIVAMISTASVFTTEAAPVNVISANTIEDMGDVIIGEIHNIQKRQESSPTHSPNNPRTTPSPDRPKPTPTPRPTDPEPIPPPPRETSATRARTTTAAAPRPSHTTAGGGTNRSQSSGGASNPTNTSGAAPSTTSPAAGSNDDSVPTTVSTKVLIGLGTVGGFFVFALGGLAFCRHRKKKNLASALLQQTAQFNNNNPYAKLPEPVASPKESLPMTPTKPLGTYTVIDIYTPTLDDEIEMCMGDSVTILQEFDDGWCMGINNTRGDIKGVFPRHCVEMGRYEGSQHGAPGGPHYPPSPSFKAAANKRMSSIAPPNGWGQAGYNNVADYPPQPSPHYPNQGPPYQGGGGGGYYNGGGY
ncbi:hypothetical protein BX616_000634 [Lobosporangium transversale]|nr:hypothetical protein BX616_000634 [Lobosporangium transversale]